MENVKMAQTATPALGTKRKKFRIRKASKKQFSKRFTRSRAGNVFYFSFLTLAGIFCLLPLVYSIVTSFKPLDEIMIFPPKFFVKRPTIANYIALPELLSGLEVSIDRYIFNSIFVGIVATVLFVAISSVAAFSLSKGKYSGRDFMFKIIQYALLFNSYTLALPQYIILTKLHVVDTYWAYILPHMASTMGIFLMKQYMDGYVSETFIEAGKIDGASYLRIFWTIVIPIIRPAMLTLTLFGFQAVWAYLPGTTVYTETVKTLPMITAQVTSAGVARTGSSMALTVLMMIPPIVIYLATQSGVTETMSSAGIKE